MFKKTKKIARRSIGLLAFMGALLWGNHASAQTVNVDVYQGTSLLESEGMVFGLTANGSGDNVVRPPGTPTPTGTKVYFLNSTWIEDENNNPITVKLTEDYHTIGSLSEVWTIEVKNPTGGDLFLSFDGAPLGSLGSLVLNSLDADVGEIGYYANKDITGDFTGANKLPVDTGKYTVAYTFTPAADLTVYCRDLDGNSIGGWQYSYTGESAVYPGVDQWFVSGVTEAVEKGREFTVSFRTLDKYDTPVSYTATMPESGSGLSYTAVYKKRDVRAFDVTYQFKDEDNVDAPVPATALANMTWSVYEVDGLGDPVETDPETGNPVYYIEDNVYQFAGHVSGFDSAGNEVSQTGTTLRSLPYGNWKVVFNDVDFKDGTDATVIWTTPDVIEVTVDTAEQVVELSGTYELTAGELTVTPADYTIYETDSTGFEVKFTVTAAPLTDITVDIAPAAGSETLLNVSTTSFTVATDAVFPYTETITVTPIATPGIAQHELAAKVNFTVTAPENDPRYMTGTEVVNVKIIDEVKELDPTTSKLTFIPQSVDFGEVIFEDPEVRYVVVESTRDTTDYIEFFFVGEQGDFEVVGAPVEIPAGESVAIPVTMTAVELGTYSTDLVVTFSPFDGENGDRAIVATIPLTGDVVDASGVDLEVYLDPAVVVANSGNSDAVEFSVSVFANSTSTLTASDSVVLTVPTEVDLSGLADTATLTFNDTAKTITYVEDTKQFVADSETVVIEFTAPVDVTTDKIVPLTITSSLGSYDVITQSGQLAITDAIQLGNLDVDADGLIFLEGQFIYDFDDIQILFNYISSKASGLTDQQIVDFGILLQGTVEIGEGVTADDILVNVLALTDSGLLDVDGDGLMFLEGQFVYDFDDIQILFNYISSKASGLTDQQIVDFGILLQGTVEIGEGVTAEDVLENVLKIIN